tara:strand:- start:614 stop:922 length:309 start_codon:yes stop_codon:yes gene_type:complete
MDADEIRDQREKAGWSRQELAEKIDAPASGIYKWEKGHSRPSKKNLKRLEDVFNGSADSGAGNASGENEYLHKRIADLEALVASQEKTIEAFRTALERIAKS